MEIKAVELNDLNEINEIQRKFFEGFNFYKYDTLVDMVNNKNVVFIKAVENNKIKGYMIAYILIDHIDIYQIATDLLEQNKGIASNLIQRLDMYRLPIIIEVKETNQKAISFYEKHNFKLIKIMPKYYECANGLLYRKDYND